MNTIQKHLIFIVLGAIILLAACGNEPEPTPTPVPPTNTPAPTDTPTPTPTDTPVPTPTPSPTPTPIPADVLIEEGDAHLLQSEWEEAIAAYQTAIDLHNDPIALAHLSFLYVIFPDTREEGLELAQEAANLAPEDANVLAYLSWAFNFNYQPDEAVTAAEEAVELDPENALAMTILASAYLGVNRYDEALSVAEDAVDLNIDLALARFNLADVYSAVNRDDDAIDAGLVGFAMEPGFVPFIVQQASLQGLDGDEEAELSMLNDALDIDPTYIGALASLAGYHRDDEAYDEALDVCDQIVEFYPELPHGYSCRGFTYLEREVYDEALDSFDLAIDRDVEWADGYFGRGRVLLNEDDCAAGRSEFEKVVTLRPYNGFMHAFIGFTYLCEEETAAAIESFQTAVSMNPYSSISLYGLGIAYFDEERYEEAEAQFRASLELDDSSYLPYLSLGRTLAELERFDEAEEVYLQALDVDDEEIDVYLALGDFYLDRDRYFDAQTQYEAALELNEESTSALVGLGVALALQDRCGAALTYFDQARDLDPDNFVASDLYNQCFTVWRYDNPPGPQGDIINEGTAASLAASAVTGRIGISGDAIITEFQSGEAGRVLVVGYLSNFDPNTNPTEFANEINAAVFAATDAFVRTDSAPVFLIVQAFAIQGTDVVLLGTRGVHRTDAVDWWNGAIGDGAYIGKFST